MWGKYKKIGNLGGKVKTLSQISIKKFNKYGVALVRDAFSPEWIADLRIGLDYNLANPSKFHKQYTPAQRSGGFFGDYCNWQKIVQFENFIKNSPASKIAKELMGSKKVNFFHEHVLVKEPGTEEKTPWHHDQPYYCVNGRDNVSLWVPLDPVPKSRGLEFIAGSHKWDVWYNPKKFIGMDYKKSDDKFQKIPNFDKIRDRYKILAFDLRLGDCIAFHFKTVHGARGNSSSRVRRRAISWRWTGDDATFAIRKGEMSPPFTDFKDCNLRPGEPLDSKLFPLIHC